MRSKYNILWLDDDFENETAFLSRLVRSVETHLKGKGYIPNIIKIATKHDAMEKISSNLKIDLFLSDYNISSDDEFSGFDFLLETRKKYKQEMLLYSNQDEQQLKQHIIKYLKKDSTPLEYFSKFVFESANNSNLLRESIKSIIDLTLIRWNELNALRGFYLSETSQIHYDAKEYIKNHIPDQELVNNFLSNYPNGRRYVQKRTAILKMLRNQAAFNEVLLDMYEVQCILSNSTNALYNIWDEVRNIRNGCAHIKESFDQGYVSCITLKDGTMIHEGEIDEYRKKLLNFVAKFYESYPSFADDVNKEITPV